MPRQCAKREQPTVQRIAEKAGCKELDRVDQPAAIDSAVVLRVPSSRSSNVYRCWVVVPQAPSVQPNRHMGLTSWMLETIVMPPEIQRMCRGSGLN